MYARLALEDLPKFGSELSNVDSTWIFIHVDDALDQMYYVENG